MNKRTAPAMRGAAAVTGVAAFVSALIATGRPGALHPALEAMTALEARPMTAAVSALPATDVPGVTGADDIRQDLAPRAQFAPPVPVRASRAHARVEHRWVRPNHGVLTSCFCMRWGTLHPGIDLAAAYGTPVMAATDGCITFAAYDGGYGNAIKINDWDGTETLYGHLSAIVKSSGCVKAGEVIGREGSTGFSTGPHLHFEVHVNGVTIDPIPFMTKRGVKI